MAATRLGRGNSQQYRLDATTHYFLALSLKIPIKFLSGPEMSRRCDMDMMNVQITQDCIKAGLVANHPWT